MSEPIRNTLAVEQSPGVRVASAGCNAGALGEGLAEGLSPQKWLNPFSAARLRPGAIPYLFSPEASAAGIQAFLAALDAARGWGAIVGPHGSGKSTLVRAAQAALARRGDRVLLVTLHDGERRLPGDAIAALGASSGGRASRRQLVVDGYEQLSWPQRVNLCRRCRSQTVCLLVTAHSLASCCFPCFRVLVRTRPATEAVACRVVDELQRGYAAYIERGDVAEALARSGGNLREALFRLYDAYEARRRECRARDSLPDAEG